MDKVFPPGLMRTHHRADVSFTHGEGPWLYASDGRRFLDFVSGIAVNSLGHAHPELLAAISRQASRLIHVSNLYRVAEQEALADRLREATFAEAVYFCNSGAEAAEGAIKLARRTWFEEGQPERNRIVTLTGAFHGRTMGALAATGNAEYARGFAPLPEGFDQIPANDVQALEAAVTERTAAIMFEPIQAEGGLRPISPEFLHAVETVRKRTGALVMLDEVQSGVGRTGSLFAYEQLGLTPDMMMLAKGLGGGVPIGAVLVSGRVASRIGPGSHGSTFGGNPLAMAAGCAVLDVVRRPGFLENVSRLGERLQASGHQLVERYPSVFSDVRGRGLLFGMRCVRKNADMVAAAFERGLLCHTAGENVLRLLPPLIIEAEHVDHAMSVLEDVARSASREAA
ncbi:MAG: aspartate aminotransferase family protein [Aestuariivirga sp.]|uniref:aspartate aminotransferase family protein n=1 Tax=Aestuariivirga sp. TaxID=2650926 RepID=UPI0038CFAB64